MEAWTETQSKAETWTVEEVLMLAPPFQAMLTPKQRNQSSNMKPLTGSLFAHSVIKCLSSTSIKLFVSICALMQDNQLSWKKKNELYNILACF